MYAAAPKIIKFADWFQPEYVLILAGDHIYKMDYEKMIKFHLKNNADVTVASATVSIKEASRFGIINARKDGRIFEFEEKPAFPKSCLASMGIYVFKWSTLKEYLKDDSERNKSFHDFGKDILPKMLLADELMYTYKFDGYWRDVGTVNSLWEANMDQIDNPSAFQLWDDEDLYMKTIANVMSSEAVVNRSIISENCTILGRVDHSVLGASVRIGRGTEIVDSVVMPDVYIRVKKFSCIKLQCQFSLQNR